ncbi:hypothetical protein ACFO3J_13745 [Streptomyces polygonati]|uniref:C-type cytochrome biogenesis protein CcmI n=1 Tax=Streptomyces polygonati TaxID=1617087 RepID=A0ABV8HLQ7_9ACTN
MAALAWLIIPVAAALLATLWARWAGRARGAGDGESLADYERFRLAMETLATEDAVKHLAKEDDVMESLGAQGQEAGEEDSPRGPVVGPVP